MLKLNVLIKNEHFNKNRCFKASNTRFIFVSVLQFFFAKTKILIFYRFRFELKNWIISKLAKDENP